MSGPGWRQRRSWLWALAVALVIGVSALLTALVAPHGDAVRLGPDNPRPDGSRALVRILRQQGVTVLARRNSEQVVTATDAGSTLMVIHPELLGPAQLDRLAEDDAAHLVLVEPNETALSSLAPDVQLAGTSDPAVLAPNCAAPAATAAGTARAGGYGYRAGGVDSGGANAPVTICYPTPDAKNAGAQGSYLVERTARRTVTVIGQSQLLTNEYLAQDGNAALALTTLGEQPKLIWYRADPLEPDSAGATKSLFDLLPRWVFWVIVQAFVVVVLTMIWRSRRLGALVPEPLPVVVRASETQEGRARLYRQSAARGRAGATLRTSTLRRIASRLAAPSATTPDQLVGLLAEATGQDPAALRNVLLGPAPASDADLIALADELDLVEGSLSARR